ncbi:hypothetical protein PG996_000006 [Apiospora saccharicola]|uniref:Uncharacterized protein n=1 Tax=Apiospora saccharicola TaxID=335842 RepID=A0ABR1WCJ4_9PEZI
MPLAKGTRSDNCQHRREPFLEALTSLKANAVDSHSVPIVTPAVSILYYQHWPAYHESRGMVSYMHPWRFVYTHYDDDKKRAGLSFVVNDEALDWELISAWVDSLALDLRAEAAPQYMPGSRLRGWDRHAMQDWAFSLDPATCFGDVRRQGLPSYAAPVLNPQQGHCPPWKVMVPADSLHPATLGHAASVQRNGLHGWVSAHDFDNALMHINNNPDAPFPGPTLKLPRQADGTLDWKAMPEIFARVIPLVRHDEDLVKTPEGGIGEEFIGDIKELLSQLGNMPESLLVLWALVTAVLAETLPTRFVAVNVGNALRQFRTHLSASRQMMVSVEENDFAAPAATTEASLRELTLAPETLDPLIQALRAAMQLRSQELALNILRQSVEPAEEFDAGLCDIMQRHLSAADLEEFEGHARPETPTREPVDETISDADDNGDSLASAELIARQQPSEDEDVDMESDNSWTGLSDSE